MTEGFYYAVIGAAIAMCAGIGSIIGVSRAGQASAALLSKDPSKFGSCLILQLLPATQAIYGFVVAIVLLSGIGIFGAPVALTAEEGIAKLVVCIPVGVVGLLSAIGQGNVAVSSINLTGKQEGQTGKAIMMTALVEFFAILAFIISILGAANG
ncbi:MAG: V-type ATP synthase subunit K [Clostridia bacterium]|nr:V-type ATP synthase subunit K [Clostridia bacterium]MBP5592891.1 V-type ATP synthase subunit K [Clostridia bacterium]MBP5649054.1 V-type ATP synthase subunit K [Clostridia bacterium]